MYVIVGYIVVLAAVLGGYALAGGAFHVIWQPIELLIIGGAAAGAFMVGNSPKTIRATIKALPTLLQTSKYTKARSLALMALLYDVLSKIRKEGMMAIESDVDDPEQSALFQKHPEV
ncbi:MAG: motility-associated protein, partial [Burkholderiaceae bacterium]